MEIRQRPSPFSLSTAQAVEREKGENDVVFRLLPVETGGYVNGIFKLIQIGSIILIQNAVQICHKCHYYVFVHTDRYPKRAEAVSCRVDGSQGWCSLSP